MATMSATRYNPQMKVFYERLKDNGKHTTLAQIAVMRKLVVVAHSLFNDCFICVILTKIVNYNA